MMLEPVDNFLHDIRSNGAHTDGPVGLEHWSDKLGNGGSSLGQPEACALRTNEGDFWLVRHFP